MIRLFTLALLAVSLFAQSDPGEDIMVSMVRENLPKWHERAPGAVIERILENEIRWRRPDNTLVSVFGRDVGHVDTATGELHIREPRLWETNRGYVVRGGRSRARIVHKVNGADGDESDVGVYHRVNGGWKGFDLHLPQLTLLPGDDFVFSAGNLRVRLREGGFDLFTAPIATAQGVVNYNFPVHLRGVVLQERPNGSLSAGPRFSLSRARMVGANEPSYPCSAWRVLTNSYRFRCDDSALPAEAYPYYVDPTGSYYPGASSDTVLVWGNKPIAQPWPPTVGSGSATDTTLPISRSKHPSDVWSIALGFLVFDTSGIPDGATISAASLNLYVTTAILDVDDYSFEAEWWDTADMPVGTEDFVNTISGDAHAGTDLGSVTGSNAWNVFTLINLSNIVDDDDTGVRIGIDGSGEPTDENEFRWATYTSANDPYLEVTYTEALAISLQPAK